VELCRYDKVIILKSENYPELTGWAQFDHMGFKKYNRKIRSESERKRWEDAVLMILKLEDEDMKQGV
jgi:hypothetical protein